MTREEKIKQIRDTELELSRLYKTRIINTPIHLCLGQEEICVAVCENLTKDDLLFAYYRSHGWYLAKGGDKQKLMDECMGLSSGCSGGKGGSMHLIDLSVGFQGTTAIVGAQLAHAVGAAFGLKMQGKDNKVVVVFGDGATDEGIFYESMNFAALHNLNIYFICMNDGRAVNIPLHHRQFQVSLVTKACEQGILSSTITDLELPLLPEIFLHPGPRFLNISCEKNCPHVGPLCQ